MSKEKHFYDLQEIFDFLSFDYKFDTNDYFIEKYNIDKRTQEFTKSNNKVRKLTKKNNTKLLKYKP